MKLPNTKILPNLQGDWTTSNTVYIPDFFLKIKTDHFLLLEYIHLNPERKKKTYKK